MVDRSERAGAERGPRFLASVGGFLRPGRDTAREGAAGSTLLLGLAGGAAALGVIVAVRRRR